MMDLSIVIVNWNTKKLLSDCLMSVFTTVQGLEFEVIVLDNASNDGSVDMMRKNWSQVVLIESRENLGFAGGNNVALKYATGKYILFLNPDTVILGQAIRQLYEVLENIPRLGVVGAQLLNPDGSYQKSWGQFPNLLTEIPILRNLNHVMSLKPTYPPFSDESLLPVAWVSGACLMTRQKLLEQIGPLDEDYWLYTEETDWCYRARRAGWSIALLPIAQVIHIARAASCQNYVGTMLHFYRSRLLFMRKHHGNAQELGTRAILCCKAIMWMLTPSVSPLHLAYSDLSNAKCRQAYWRLLSTLILYKGVR